MRTTLSLERVTFSHLSPGFCYSIFPVSLSPIFLSLLNAAGPWVKSVTWMNLMCCQGTATGDAAVTTLLPCYMFLSASPPRMLECKKGHRRWLVAENSCHGYLRLSTPKWKISDWKALFIMEKEGEALTINQ